MVYCDSIFDVFIIDHYNLAECPKYDYLCSMFHSESDKKTKNKKFSYLENPQSDLRIIYTTSALVMGLDIQGFHSLFLNKPPLTTVTLSKVSVELLDISILCAVLLHNSRAFIDTDEKCVIRYSVAEDYLL